MSWQFLGELRLADSENAIGQLHSIFLLFPIILFTAVLICDLTYGMGKQGALKVGHWLVILGLLFCIPTIITGQEAAKSFDPLSPNLQQHLFLGFATGFAASLYAGFRIAAMLWTLRIKSTIYIGLSVLMAALVSWTSDYGALITREPVSLITPAHSIKKA